MKVLITTKDSKMINMKMYKVKVKSLSRVRLFATPWTVAYQAPPSMGFSRQEYRNGVPLPSPGEDVQEDIKIKMWRGK